MVQVTTLLTRALSPPLSQDVGHSRLVPHEGGQVHWLASVIFGERLDFAAMAPASLPRQKAERSVSGSLVLAVTL